MSKPKTVILVCENTLAAKFLQEALQQRIGYMISEFGFSLYPDDESEIKNIQFEQQVVCIVVLNEFSGQDTQQERDKNIQVYTYWRALFPLAPIVWCDEDAQMHTYMFRWTDCYRLSMQAEVDAQIHVEHAEKYGTPFSYFEILVQTILKVASRSVQLSLGRKIVLICDHISEQKLIQYMLTHLSDIDAKQVEDHILMCDQCGDDLGRLAEKRLSEE